MNTIKRMDTIKPACEPGTRTVSRTGSVLAVTIVCVLLTSVIIVGSLRSLLLTQRQNPIETRQRQLEILLADLLEQSVKQYAHTGELPAAAEWTVPAEQWAIAEQGQVHLTFSEPEAGYRLLTMKAILTHQQQPVQKLTRSVRVAFIEKEQES